MEIDQTSFNDLAIFSHHDEFSVFNKLDFTETLEGREWLLRYFKNPFSDYGKILETQHKLSDKFITTWIDGLQYLQWNHYGSCQILSRAI
jgi:DNA mismatch repair ATPase MutS